MPFSELKNILVFHEVQSTKKARKSICNEGLMYWRDHKWYYNNIYIIIFICNVFVFVTLYYYDILVYI